MPHSGNWRRFDFSTPAPTATQASFEDLQKVCHHPRQYWMTEMDGHGDDVKIKTTCYLCLKTISEE